MDAETTTILIDTALAGGSASALDPEERRLQELVLALRDDAPVPDADFALRMNARVAAGFPARRRRLPARGALRPRMAIAGGLAAALIAVLVAVSVGGGADHRAAGGSAAAGSAASGPAAGAAQAAGGSAASGSGTGAAQAAGGSAASGSAAGGSPSTESAPLARGIAVPQPAPAQPGGFVGGGHRKVERSALLVLAPDRDKLDDVGNQVIAVSDRYHGIVMQSSVTSGSDQTSGGSFELRIPVRNLQAALRDLSALADVESRTENAGDVTASFVNARTRLQELEAERRGLLRRLEKAPTDQAAAAIRSRIRLVNGQIQAQQSELTSLRRRTSYASVNVTLQPKQHATGGGIGSGARDLRDSLIDAANTALRVLGVALPLALLGALLWLVAGWTTRRRREAALD